MAIISKSLLVVAMEYDKSDDWSHGERDERLLPSSEP